MVEETMLFALLVVVVLIVLTILGLGLNLQSELLLNPRAARSLKALSRVCFFIVGLISLGLGNVVGFVLAMFILGRWFHFQMTQRWASQKAAELELIWLLALSAKSEKSLVDEIQMYSGGATGARKRRLLAFATDLQNGVPLQTCLPYELFSRPTALQLQSALNSDTFVESLTRLAISQGKALADRQQDLGYSIVAYPCLLLVVLFGICSFQMYYIIPKFKKIFDDFGTDLPEITKATIRFSDFCVNYWYLIVPPVVAAAWLIRRYLVSGRYDSEASAVMGLLGRFFVRIHAPEILRALAMTVSSGQSVTEGVKVLAQQPDVPLIQSTINRLTRHAQQGHSVWGELRFQGVLRSSELNLIEAAGRAGNLPWVLETLAENLERRWKFRFNVIGGILHPVLILLASLPIGFFAIAMFMPLIKLLNDLS